MGKNVVLTIRDDNKNMHLEKNEEIHELEPMLVEAIVGFSVKLHPRQKVEEQFEASEEQEVAAPEEDAALEILRKREVAAAAATEEEQRKHGVSKFFTTCE